MPRPIAIVTGASSGIGLASAVALAGAGFHVVATMRDLAKCGPLRAAAEAAGSDVEVGVLDVTDDASASACITEILERRGRIDLLVNNAGVGFLGTLEQISLDDLRGTMEVNFFGVARVTRLVVPSMRAAGKGRIITVSSVGGLIGQPFNDGYCAAKFAVEGLMESLAPVLKRFGVHVSLVEPGPVHTEFVANLGASLTARTADPEDPYRKLLDGYLAATRDAFGSLGQTAEDIAAVIVAAATADQPHLRYPTSAAATAVAARKFVDPTGDQILAISGSRLPPL